MTLGQEYLLFVVFLPLALVVGMTLGHFIILRRLRAGFRGYDRPALSLLGKPCRVVKEEDFAHLRAWGHLDYEERG